MPQDEEPIVVGSAVVELGTVLTTSLKEALRQFVISLLSRKLLLTLGSAFALYQAKRYLEAVGVVAAYLGVEGAADIGERVQRSKSSPIIENADDVHVTATTEGKAPHRTAKRKDT